MFDNKIAHKARDVGNGGKVSRLLVFTAQKLFLRKNFFAVRVCPGNDLNKVSHEAWDEAAKDRRVASHYILVSYLRFVKLINHCRATKECKL